MCNDFSKAITLDESSFNAFLYNIFNNIIYKFNFPEI